MGRRSGRFQNRVLPTGEIVSNTSDCMFMGNRGGRLHDHSQQLTGRRWASAHWIVCVTEFNDRQRQIMSPNSYTELFFLDEATAFASGHRPCFECRRADFMHFMACWNRSKGLPGRGYVAEVDRELHDQRCVSAAQPVALVTADWAELPVGTMVLRNDRPWLVGADDVACRWTPDGYVDHQPIRRESVTVVTPSSIVDTMRAGFTPKLHQTALAS